MMPHTLVIKAATMMTIFLPNLKNKNYCIKIYSFNFNLRTIKIELDLHKE